MLQESAVFTEPHPQPPDPDVHPAECRLDYPPQHHAAPLEHGRGGQSHQHVLTSVFLYRYTFY